MYRKTGGASIPAMYIENIYALEIPSTLIDTDACMNNSLLWCADTVLHLTHI